MKVWHKKPDLFDAYPPVLAFAVRYLDGNNTKPIKAYACVDLHAKLLKLYSAEPVPASIALDQLQLLVRSSRQRCASYALRQDQNARLEVYSQHLNTIITAHSAKSARKTSLLKAWAALSIAVFLSLGWFALNKSSQNFLLAQITPQKSAQLQADYGEWALFMINFFEPQLSYCTAQQGQDVIAQIITKLKLDEKIPALKINVIDSKIDNAYTSFDGRIDMLSGLATDTQRPRTRAQIIAGVLAHEAGHAYYRDPERSYLSFVTTNKAASLLSFDLLGESIEALLLDMLLQEYQSRAIEYRADRFAAQILGEAGYNNRGLSYYFKQGNLEHSFKPLVDFAELFASHPHDAKRIAALKPLFKSGEALISQQDLQHFDAICSQKSAPIDNPIYGLFKPYIEEVQSFFQE